MAANGPPYMGLWRERTATIENMRQLMVHRENETTGLTAAQLAVQLEILDGYWSRFQDVQRCLMVEYAHIEEVSCTMGEVERDTQSSYVAAKAQLLQQQSQLQIIQQRPRAPRASEIKIDTFSGKYTEWAAWRSQFKAKVLDANIDVADKISLLTGALTKEAATCAGRAERLDQVELDRIWSKLDRTYDNKYQQVYAHIAEIISIAPMTQPSADKLRSMIDIVDQHLRMLKRFDINTEHWSPLVCVLLLGKLDLDTRNQWESKESLPAMPDLKELFAYLEQRILAIRNIEMSSKRIQNSSAVPNGGGSTKSSSQNSNTKDNRFHPYERKTQPHQPRTNVEARAAAPSNAPECQQCRNGSQHFLWNCDAFKKLQSAAKLSQLAEWGICEVCLIAKHKAAECSKGTCPVCKVGHHNSLVCPQAVPRKVAHLRRRVKKPPIKTAE